MPQPTRFAVSTRADVFISYAHADDRFLNELLRHLEPVLGSEPVGCWSDLQIAVGEEWRSAIAAALERANIAILLVSPSFLASRVRAVPALRPHWGRRTLAFLRPFSRPPAGSSSVSCASSKVRLRTWKNHLEMFADD